MHLHSKAQCDCSLLLLGLTTSGLEEPFISWTFVGVQAENDCRCVSGIEQTHRRISRTTRTGSRRRSMCCFVVRPSRRPSEKGLWGTWRNSCRCFYYLYVCLNLLLSIWGVVFIDNLYFWWRGEEYLNDLQSIKVSFQQLNCEFYYIFIFSYFTFES